MTERPSRPDGRLQVAPAQLPGPRGSRARAYVALAVVVGVIAVGVGLSSLGSSGSPQVASSLRATGSLGPAASAGGSALPSPASSQAIALDWLALPNPAELTAGELEAGVADGSLDGALVFIRGRLVAQEQLCGQSFAVECVIATVPGLNLPIDLVPALVYWEAPPPGSFLVMHPVAGRLVYLGVVRPDDPVSSMSEVLARRPTRPFPMTLAPVVGWLVTDPFGQCSPAPSDVPCPVASPFLADDHPLRDGTVPTDRGASVAIEAGAVGLASGMSWLFGTYLVRHAFHSACDTSSSPCVDVVRLGWDVVARMDGIRWFEVTVPSPAGESSPAGDVGDGPAASPGLQP